MTKVMSIGSLVVLSGLPNIHVSDTTALQLASGNTQLSRIDGGAIRTMAVVSVMENMEVAKVHSYKYASFELSGEDRENAIITLDRGYQVGGVFRRDSSIEKTYPCERTFLSLEPASGDSSYAVYSLSANTEELGRLSLNDHYVDRSSALPHRTRMDHLVYDDVNSRTVGTLVTFVIDRENVERQVSSAPNSSQPYEMRTEKDEKYMNNPNGGNNVRVYVRPDGQKFRRNWEGTVLVEKSVTQPAPTSAPAPQSGSTSSGGGKSNIFEKCTIC